MSQTDVTYRPSRESTDGREKLDRLSEAQQAEVLVQLDRILEHQAFRHSHHYPNLLRYIVEHTLSGSGPIKERTLGVEVFGRRPGYDTNDDPVVRTTAGQIRRRLAQYYEQDGHESELRIDLPCGAYVAEFYLPGPRPSASTPESEVVPDSRPSPVVHRTFRKQWLAYALLAAAVVGFMAWSARMKTWASSSPLEDFWRPILVSSESPLVCIGEPYFVVPQGTPAGEQFSDASREYGFGSDRVALADAAALFHIAEFLGSHGSASRFQGAAATTFEDLRQGPAVLVAAFDNPWTLRIGQSLRYRLSPPGERLAWIEDQQHPAARHWVIDLAEQYSKQTQDYAIVSRFRDPTTGEPMVIAAGLGESGTAVAGEFVTNAEEIRQALQNAPKDWRSKNIEFVLGTQVIYGKFGPPRVLATYFW